MTRIHGLAVILAMLLAAAPTLACPFCNSQGQTLSGEVAQADMILLVKVKSAKQDPDDLALTKGSTEMQIESIIKPHDYITGRTTLTIPRYVPVGPKEKDTTFILFCNLYPRATDTPFAAVASSLLLANPKAQTIDAYRGDPLPPKSELAKYLKGAQLMRQKDATSRLRYFFDYLDASELLISTDAYMEFGNTDYKDVRKLAETLPAEKLVKWMTDPNTPQSRLGLYGLLLGHAGKAEQAAALRQLITDPAYSNSSGLDGMMTGYTLLDPKAGWEHVLAVAGDRKKEFNSRMAALKVMRFLHEYRPDVITNDKLVDGLRLMVQQSDMADLPIEDLRKWQAWDQTSFVLSYATAESHKINIIRRAILRFALTASPHNKEAAAYIEQIRKTEPERVKLVEEMLQDEEPKKK